MKKIAIVIFDDFTDIDLFLMWDILGRNTSDWQVKILRTKDYHCSAHGLSIPTHGNVSQANDSDVVLFASGKKGAPNVLNVHAFIKAFSLNPNKQIIGSICAGAFILHKLGLLQNMKATTHPEAKAALQQLNVDVIDKPIVYKGNVATAGGCLAVIYLIGWVIEKLYGKKKSKQTLRELLPAGQHDIYEKLIASSIQAGVNLFVPDSLAKEC